MKTNRYKGLVYLRENGFPVPNFLKISSTNDLDYYLRTYSTFYAPLGWTIRTCKNSGENEFLLFYKNRLSYDKLVKLLKIKLQKNSNEFYIIYPSWSFLFSFNIIKEMNRYIIEGVYKSQKTISAYSKLPDFVFIYDRVTDRFMSKIDCKQESLLIHSIRKVIKHMENIHYNNCYSEVAFTTERKIFFYEFWLL